MEKHKPDIDPMLRNILRDVLGLGDEQVAAMNDQSLLFGALPEMDSMAVATLLTEIEDRFNIVIDDDDIDAETFESFGNMMLFLHRKV